MLQNGCYTRNTYSVHVLYVAFTDFVYMIQCIYCLTQVSLVGIIGAWICERILDLLESELPFHKQETLHENLVKEVNNKFLFMNGIT